MATQNAVKNHIIKQLQIPRESPLKKMQHHIANNLPDLNARKKIP